MRRDCQSAKAMGNAAGRRTSGALMYLFLRRSVLIIALASVPCLRAELVIERLDGTVTSREIEAFKTHMRGAAKPPLPFQPSHNAWAFGSGGRGIEALGLMYEATADRGMLDLMILWTDECVSQRNDLLPSDKGGHRVMWTGKVEKVWCPEAPTHKNAQYAGCETEDTIAHIAYCAKLILQHPELWKAAVPDRNSHGYGATYLERAKGYLAKCDESNDEYFLKWFVQPTTNLIRDPANQPVWAAIHNNVDSINRQFMFDGGYQRLAECHEILNDAPDRVRRYDAVVKTSMRECLDGIKKFDPKIVAGHPVYNWHYFPWSNDKTKSESVGHAAYDVLGLYRASQRGAYGLKREELEPIANTLVYVIARGKNAFAETVDGKGKSGNFMLGEWILCADWNPAAYDLVANAAVASRRYQNDPNLTAHILWMKQRRANGKAG
jgi:hypothetical protein